MIKHYIVKHITTIAKHFVIGFAATMIAWGFLFPGEKLASKLFGIEEDFYLKYFYSIINYPDVDFYNYDKTLDYVKIVDLHNYRNRRDQSIILEKIYDYKPRIIGVDVFYDDNPDLNDSVNSMLKKTVNRIKDKTVFICTYKNIDENSKIVETIYPFFYSSSNKDSFFMASSRMSGFFDYYQSNDSSILNKTTSSPVLPRICYAIVKHSGLKMNDYDGKDFYINYSKKNPSEFIISDTSEIHKDNIEDKIVLVGDLAETKDLYKLPIKFGKQDFISGVEDIAYRIISLIQTDEKKGSVAIVRG